MDAHNIYLYIINMNIKEGGWTRKEGTGSQIEGKASKEGNTERQTSWIGFFY